jgi:hypothetical protein
METPCEAKGLEYDDTVFSEIEPLAFLKQKFCTMNSCNLLIGPARLLQPTKYQESPLLWVAHAGPGIYSVDDGHCRRAS